MIRLGIPTPNHSNNWCLPISVRKDFNERAHVQTSARTANRGRNAKSDHNCYSLDPFPSDVVVAVADLALEAGELAVLVARLALQALRLHHLI